MSTFNRITKPRAYVDMISFNLANGWRDLDDITILQNDGSTAVTFDAGVEANLFDMRPSDNAQIAHDTQQFYIQFNTGFGTDTLGESSFLAILNHNFDDADVEFRIEISDETAMDPSDANYGVTVTNSASQTTTLNNANSGTAITANANQINAQADGTDGYINPAYNGWTLLTWDNQTTDNQYLRLTFKDHDSTNSNFAEDVKIGSILYGEIVDFPSPDMGITTTIDYDGTTLQQSIGGATFSNSQYLGQPTWVDTNPWTISTVSNQHTYGFDRRYGRMKHSMKYSYLADTDLWTTNQHGHDTLSQFYDAETLHSNFYNRILGQHLPFLFSIDKDSTSEGDFGLFRLSNSGLSSTQVAHRVWDVAFDITETW